MKIYIISLETSLRRSKIKERLNEINLDFEFISAVDKNSITENEINALYNADECKRRHGRDLVKAEIACFMSHIKAWHKIADQNECAIILEDDAILTSDFKFATDFLRKSQHDNDVVLLGRSKQRIEDEKKHYFHNPIFNKIGTRKFAIGEVFKLWTSGMVGYYVTRIGAKKLIKSNNKIKCVSDDWSYHAENGIIIKEARPYVVWEDFDNMPSNIESERSSVTKKRNIIISTALPPVRIVRALYRNLMVNFKQHKQ